MGGKAMRFPGAPTPPLCHADTFTDSHAQLLPVPHGAHQDGVTTLSIHLPAPGLC